MEIYMTKNVEGKSPRNPTEGMNKLHVEER